MADTQFVYQCTLYIHIFYAVKIKPSARSQDSIMKAKYKYFVVLVNVMVLLYFFI